MVLLLTLAAIDLSGFDHTFKRPLRSSLFGISLIYIPRNVTYPPIENIIGA